MHAESAIDLAVLDLIGQGKAVLFIGAGFSLVPTDTRTRDRKGLKETLIESYRGTLTDIIEKVHTMSMEDIVFFLRVRGTPKKEIMETLRKFVASSEELAKLRSFTLLRNLLQIRPHLFEAIITTNWDQGIEESLRSIPTLKLERFVRDEDCLNYRPSHLSVLKIHGDIDDANSIILSTQDFDLYEKEHPRIIERLRILFSTKYLVLLGYGARDENFRRIYRSLHFDVGGQSMPGGCIVAPRLGEGEQLWTRDVNLRHFSTTAQEFLSTTLSHLASIPLGTRPVLKRGELTNDIRLKPDTDLDSLATTLKQKYALNEVWVARLRGGQRPNSEIGSVASIYLEARCSAARSLAISTGETMAAVANTVNTSSFQNRVRILSTIVLMTGLRGFNDPSHIAQTLVSRFAKGRADGVPMRLPDEAYLSWLFKLVPESKIKGIANTVRQVAESQVARAMESEVIIGSARPCDWFGGSEMPGIRTLPIQELPGVSVEKVNMQLERSGAIAVHHMNVLDADGQDVLKLTSRNKVLKKLDSFACRPSVGQLKLAAKSKKQKVILVASSMEKTTAVDAILRAKLCNVIVVDETLAVALAK